MNKVMALGTIVLTLSLSPLIPESALGLCGDATNNGTVNIADVTTLIDYVFISGAYPGAQAECDGMAGLNALDVLYLISYLFCAGPAPVCPATQPACIPVPDPNYQLIYGNVMPAGASVIQIPLKVQLLQRCYAVSLPLMFRVAGEKPQSITAQVDTHGWQFSGRNVALDSGVVIFYGFGQCLGNDTCMNFATVTIGMTPQPFDRMISCELTHYEDADPMIVDNNRVCKLPIVTGAATPTCASGTICDGTITGPTFSICPGGDAIFQFILRDALGNPVAGDSSVYIDMIGCAGVTTCPPTSAISRLYPINRSGFDGTLRFVVAGGGCNSSCVAEVKAPCGLIASVPVRNFDTNGDFGVSPSLDYTGSECNNYDSEPGIQAQDYDLLAAHSGHHCGLTPCERFGAVFSLSPGTNLTPGQDVQLSLILTNNNFDSCRVSSIDFYSSGFGNGGSASQIQSVAYGAGLAPGASDTVTVTYEVPGIGHGCLSVQFNSDCCSTSTVLEECAQSTWHCGNQGARCYEIFIRLNGREVHDVVFRDYLAIGWSREVAHLPVLPALTPDSVIYRICTPSEGELGDDSRVFVELQYDAQGFDIETFESQVFITSRTGDADGNCLVSISDCVYLINYIFSGGGAPRPCQSGDVSCDGIVNISDVVYIINFIFAGGSAPCVPGDTTPVPTCL